MCMSLSPMVFTDPIGEFIPAAVWGAVGIESAVILMYQIIARRTGKTISGFLSIT